MLIGCKILRNHSVVASTPQSPSQCPPSDLMFGSDNTFAVCCPNGVVAAQAALAPQVANAKLFVSNDEWEVWQCEQPVSRFATNSVSLRCPQNVLHVRSKCAKPHAIQVSSQCAAEAPRWIGRIYESGDPTFVYVPCKWYDAHLQSTQPMTLTLTLRLHVRRQPSLGRRQCETKEINEQNKTVQNHHSTASIAADPVRAFANHPIVEIACTRPICLSSHAVGT